MCNSYTSDYVLFILQTVFHFISPHFAKLRYSILVLHGSTPSDRRTFGVDRLVWTEAARKGEGAPWYTGVLLGAERFMASWHKSEEEASKLREVNRAA